MKYLGSKVLETDRLLLRPTKEEDLKVIWGILCDKKVAKNYLVGKFNYDWEKEKVWQYKKLEKGQDCRDANYFVGFYDFRGKPLIGENGNGALFVAFKVVCLHTNGEKTIHYQLFINEDEKNNWPDFIGNDGRAGLGRLRQQGG